MLVQVCLLWLLFPFLPHFPMLCISIYNGLNNSGLCVAIKFFGNYFKKCVEKSGGKWGICCNFEPEYI